MTVTITFSASYTQGVENVSFTLFGIDQATGGSNIYIDELSSITAMAIDGVTQIAPTITSVGSAVTHSGTGFNQVLTGRGECSQYGRRIRRGQRHHQLQRNRYSEHHLHLRRGRKFRGQSHLSGH